MLVSFRPCDKHLRELKQRNYLLGSMLARDQQSSGPVARQSVMVGEGGRAGLAALWQVPMRTTTKVGFLLLLLLLWLQPGHQPFGQCHLRLGKAFGSGS